jgi:hypothetical protein
MRLWEWSAMSAEAVGRVPVVDWLLGLTVLVCGIAAIVAVWRYSNQLTNGLGASDEPDEGGGHGEGREPLALPPGPTNAQPLADSMDEELWHIIDAELDRLPEKVESPQPDRIAAEVPTRYAPSLYTDRSAFREREAW